MSTRTFTLEEVKKAVKSLGTVTFAQQDCIWAALLAANPEEPSRRECCNTLDGEQHPPSCEIWKGAAKPEAKTCEAWCGKSAPDDARPWKPWHQSGEFCTEECAVSGRPLNPAPAASPSPAWLPLGQHPGGTCKDWCGEKIRTYGHMWCHEYCRDRAKAQRDAAQGGDRPVFNEEDDAILDDMAAAVLAERKRCAEWASAMRMGRLDDIRSVIFGINGGTDVHDGE